MIYVFPKGINHDEMRIYNVRSLNAIAMVTQNKLIELFTRCHVAPSDVSVWYEDEFDDSTFVMGNNTINPEDDAMIVFTINVESAKFDVYTDNEVTFNNLLYGISVYGPSIFGS